MTTNLDRYSDRQRRAAEVMTVLAVMGCVSLGTTFGPAGVEWPDHAEPGEYAAALSCLALFWGRRHPRTTVTVSTVCTGVMSAQGYLLTPLVLAPAMAALYWLASYTDRKTTRIYGLVTTTVLVSAAVINDPTDHTVLLKTVGPALWLLLPLVGGSQSRFRRAYLEAAQARAEHAERTREEEARRRVTEERMRIARELHDVVAHHLALANAQAGTAAHLALADPAQTQKILTDLTGTTSSALRELKATVGLLRQANDPESESLEPAPGLDRLPDLISACESAGLSVTVTTTGQTQPLSPIVDLTAFRIVQEALTNVTKHASAKAAHIRLDYAGSWLTITVGNDGPAVTAPAEDRGFGLMGMRERAHSVGGDILTGPRLEGGFEVTAALPFQPHAPRPFKEGSNL